MTSIKKSLRKGIAVGGTRGGSGKTLFAAGMIQALTRKGISVFPFKKGPDYIDPAWLTLASGRQCRNLDAYLMSREKILESFLDGAADSNFAVIEGNRGLFDGLDIDGTYSFAELVKWLKIPLLLILDCSKSSRTLAALVRGCETFDEQLPFDGVILNQIAGNRHEKIITDSIRKYCRTPVLGALPRLSGLPFAERHLGLVPVSEHEDPLAIIKALGDAVEKYTDIESIIKIAGAGLEYNVPGGEMASESNYTVQERNGAAELTEKEFSRQSGESASRPIIGVIRDSAFNFYYAENLAALAKNGARIIELDSILDTDVPPIDALYIGGGFPETHVESLSENHHFRDKLKELVNGGLPVYAECGGLIYLSESIVRGNRRFPMAGIFPFVFELSNKPVGHGYTLFEVDGENPFYQKGAIVRGHEFRYSRIVNAEKAGKYNTVFKMRRGHGIANDRDGILYNNCLATFSHTHAYGDNIQWLDSMRRLAAAAKIR